MFQAVVAVEQGSGSVGGSNQCQRRVQPTPRCIASICNNMTTPKKALLDYQKVLGGQFAEQMKKVLGENKF